MGQYCQPPRPRPVLPLPLFHHHRGYANGILRACYKGIYYGESECGGGV